MSKKFDVFKSHEVSAKRVNIVSLKLIKESSLLYKERSVRSPEDGYRLMWNVGSKSIFWTHIS